MPPDGTSKRIATYAVDEVATALAHEAAAAQIDESVEGDAWGATWTSVRALLAAQLQTILSGE